MIDSPQLTFTCSKPTMETLEKGVKMFKINNKKPERHHWRFIISLFAL